MTKGISGHSETAKISSAVEMNRSEQQKNNSTGFDRWAGRQLLSLIGNPPITLILQDGTSVQARTNTSGIHLLIHDRSALLLLLVNPEYYFGELYTAGRIQVEGDLVELLNLVYRALYSNRMSLQLALFSLARKVVSMDYFSNAHRNIQHHYDIGNSFYEKWLDRQMQYTCAYFDHADLTLEQAQIAKMRHICRKLMLKPGQTVVEAGCGWGGLARFMAREYGVKVKAYNISREQIVYARQRADAEGLHELIGYIEDDYRNIKGEYDVFVSVGMLEHVGLKNFRELGNIINTCLKPDGIGLIHSIGFNRPGYLNPWIEKRIFPGACPPAISQMMDILEPQNFSILDIENLRLHYARTLEHWLRRFDTNQEPIRQDFDDAFVRSWRLYLSGSISAFQTGNMQLFQVLFTRAANNVLPWSRAHLYKRDGTERKKPALSVY